MTECRFVDRLEYIGVVLDSESLHTWGTSVVQGDDGLFHLYACQWPVVSGLIRWGFGHWGAESVVNYYTSPKPEGPYKFVSTIVGARPGGDHEGVWNRYSAHNPEVKRIDGYYVLTYISYPELDDMPNAKIGIKIAEQPEGPWNDVGVEGLVMQKSSKKGLPSFGSLRGTDNPSLVKFCGKYYLFFMYNPGPHDNTTLGVAVSESLSGPYVEQSVPALIPGKDKKVEDICAFTTSDTLAAVMCDNFGILTPNGGIYCELDEKEFNSSGIIKLMIRSIAWQTRPEMFPEQDFSSGTKIYCGNKFERPKILLIDDEPSYLFMPSGFNEKGDTRTVLHGFRIAAQ